MSRSHAESDEHGAFDDGDDDDIPSNPSTETPLADLIQQRLSRRATLKGLAGAAATGADVHTRSEPGSAGPRPRPPRWASRRCPTT